MMECSCWDNGLRPNMTWDELLNEMVRPGKYCTYGHHICPTLDKELRRADKERSAREHYKKRAGAKTTVSKQRIKTRTASEVTFDFEEPRDRGSHLGPRRKVKLS